MTQPSIESRMDASGMPRTFVVIDNGAGHVQMYGFAPASEGQAWGPGRAFDESTSGPGGTAHPFDWTTGQISLTVDQFNRVTAAINESIANSPYYNVLASVLFPNAVNQCATWANHLAKVGDFTDKLPWGNMGWNPYGQAVWTELGKFWNPTNAANGTPSDAQVAEWTTAYSQEVATLSTTEPLRR